MRSDQRSPSGTRIAVTLGAAVAAVMLAIWGVTALAAGLSGGLNPTPENAAVAPTATALPTLTTAATSAVTATSPATVIATKPVPKPAAPKPAVKPKPTPVAKVTGKYVVVIDPGHQGSGDPRLEPIGPGSSTMKARNTSGADGAATGQHESMLNLQVALKVRDLLQSRGVKVIMCRTSQNVTSSNAERAQMANRYHADLFLRIHADGADAQSQHGFMTMEPMANQWWSGTKLALSRRAGSLMQRDAIRATGAQDRGITNRGDMSGFNWANVPSVLVEMGFLSNPAEDRAMATASYQHKLALGISNGVTDYLHTKR